VSWKFLSFRKVVNMDERVVEALDQVIDRLLQLTPDERSAKMAGHEPGFVYHTYVDNSLARITSQAEVSFRANPYWGTRSDHRFRSELQWRHEPELEQRYASYQLTDPTATSVTWLQAA